MIKAIIFDLDDTLIDTSGSSIPIKMKEALKAMIKAGLKIDNFDQSYQLLLDIDKQSYNGTESITDFLKKIKADQKFLQIGKAAYYGGDILDFSIKELPGATKLLSQLKKKYKLVLVSYGLPSEQQSKLKKSGIKEDLFSVIIFTDNYNKKAEYQKVIDQLKLSHEQFLVVGDKFKGDLLPARELGMKTVHMFWGRGKLDNPKDADYSIKKLDELQKILLTI
ncbi:MAG TPA: HAD family hydrolase [Candidatus Nanoarchaeia archaeon]|nr:HAD family hydrolase [Candidatus Nanoarchaeia archaeon]